MANAIMERLSHAWNVFRGQTHTQSYPNIGNSYGYRPDRVRVNIANERSMLSSIYTRMAVDISDARIRHVKLRENSDYFEKIVKSRLDEALNVSANIDQTGRHLIRDMALTMFNDTEGVVAVVPVIATGDPVSDTYDIVELRCGQITEWYPQHVRVRLYDDRDGQKKEVLVPKKIAAIIENPLAPIMNEPNSTFQRLVRKLNLLDAVDEVTSSGKLDIIIQLPHVVRTDRRREEANRRRKEIEMQLTGAQYGIAYIDGTERVTQLNRPAENNLFTQITELKNELRSMLGISNEVMSGMATEEQMLNYYSRTIGPILDAFVDEFNRKFLTKNARTRRHAIRYFRDPFKLISVANLAEMGDKLTRNEIMTSNEIRGVIMFPPSDDPKADKLINSNLNQPEESAPTETAAAPTEEK